MRGCLAIIVCVPLLLLSFCLSILGNSGDKLFSTLLAMAAIGVVIWALSGPSNREVTDISKPKDKLDSALDEQDK